MMRGKRHVARPTRASILRSAYGAWVPTAEEMGINTHIKYVTDEKKRPTGKEAKAADSLDVKSYPHVLTRKQFAEQVARLCTPTFASLKRQNTKYNRSLKIKYDNGEIPHINIILEPPEEKFEQFEFLGEKSSDTNNNDIDTSANNNNNNNSNNTNTNTSSSGSKLRVKNEKETNTEGPKDYYLKPRGKKEEAETAVATQQQQQQKKDNDEETPDNVPLEVIFKKKRFVHRRPVSIGNSFQSLHTIVE